MEALTIITTFWSFFYRGFEGIFEGIDEYLPFCDINLFYDEKNLPTSVISVKFCADIHPSKSGLYHDKLVKAVTANLSAIRSFFRFFLKKISVNFHCVWEYNTVSGLLKERYRKIMVVLYVTFMPSKFFSFSICSTNIIEEITTLCGL